MQITQPEFMLKDDLWWTTTAVLPTWQARKSASSNIAVQILFAPEGRDDEALTGSEISSIVWVIQNEASILQSLLDSLFYQYPSLQEQYDCSEWEKAQCMPDIESIDDLCKLINLDSVNVHPVSKNGIPYAGFEFRCTWDSEHGLGVLMHGNRTVEIGGADTVILLWIAKKDAAKL